MDVLFTNGNFVNPNNYHENIEMIGIKSGVIAYKGEKSHDLLKQSKRVIDLEGKTLLPGFNDSHMHLLGLGLSLEQLDLTGIKSIQGIINEGIGYLKNNPSIKILQGRGWNQEYLEEQRFLTREDLDRISSKIPIVFRRTCGHILAANTTALELIQNPRKEIQGGNIDWELGILKENAQDLLFKELPVPSEKHIQKALITGANYARKNGLTSVQSDDLCVFPTGFNQRIFNAFSNLEHTLNLRVYEQSLFKTIDNFKNFIASGYQMTKTNGLFNTGPLKVLLDGALGSKTAALKAPYINSSKKGILMYDQDTLNTLVKIANDHDIDVAIHGIGDEAIERAITAIKGHNHISRRHSIVHCQITNDRILKDLKAEHILTHIQPIFLDYDIHIVENRVGKERAKKSYLYKTMDDLGIPIAFGSDAPVDQISPILGIHCAVNRQDLKGYPESGWFPNEKISIEKAIHHYTIGSAYAEHQEDRKGALEVGMYADFVILDRNPLTVKPKEIKNIKVIDTYLNGISYNNKE